MAPLDISGDVADFTLAQCMTLLSVISRWPLMDRHTRALEGFITEKFGVVPMRRAVR